MKFAVYMFFLISFPIVARGGWDRDMDMVFNSSENPILVNLSDEQKLAKIDFLLGEKFPKKSFETHQKFPSWNAESRIKKIVNSYFLKIQEDDKYLPKKQRSILRNILRVYGLENPQYDPYLDIQKISSQNLLKYPQTKKRPFERAKIKKLIKTLTEEDKSFIKSIHFLAIHNSNSQLLDIPNCSSGALEKMGGYGRNSYSYFNKMFLKTCDFVYFSVIPSTNIDELKVSSPYGKYFYVLNSQYAANRGVVGPFLMYPRELLNLNNSAMDSTGQIGCPHVNFDDEFLSTVDDTSIFEENFRCARNRLALFFLTFEDFQNLAGDVLSYGLYLLKKGEVFCPEYTRYNCIQYEDAIKSIHNPFLLRFFVGLVFKEILGFSEFELKVPFAVPSKYFDMYDFN